MACKAHLAHAEAASRGFSSAVWSGNLRADPLATAGTSGHQEDDADPELLGPRQQLVQRIHSYLFRTQCRLGNLKLTVWQRGARTAGRLLGPAYLGTLRKRTRPTRATLPISPRASPPCLWELGTLGAMRAPHRLSR